jgi:hypothetical protein
VADAAQRDRYGEQPSDPDVDWTTDLNWTGDRTAQPAPAPAVTR